MNKVELSGKSAPSTAKVGRLGALCPPHFKATSDGTLRSIYGTPLPKGRHLEQAKPRISGSIESPGRNRNKPLRTRPNIGLVYSRPKTSPRKTNATASETAGHVSRRAFSVSTTGGGDGQPDADDDSDDFADEDSFAVALHVVVSFRRMLNGETSSMPPLSASQEIYYDWLRHLSPQEQHRVMETVTLRASVNAELGDKSPDHGWNGRRRGLQRTQTFTRGTPSNYSAVVKEYANILVQPDDPLVVEEEQEQQLQPESGEHQFSEKNQEQENDPLNDESLNDDPLSDDPLNDEQLSDESLNDEPLSVDPWNDEPLIDVPWNDEPLSVDPLNDELLMDEPLNDELMIDDPLNDEPLNDEPLSDDPLKDELLIDYPLNYELLFDDPLKDEPLSDDPLSAEPVSDEPLNDEPLQLNEEEQQPETKEQHGSKEDQLNVQLTEGKQQQECKDQVLQSNGDQSQKEGELQVKSPQLPGDQQQPPNGQHELEEFE